jgi:hypothetical protein
MCVLVSREPTISHLFTSIRLERISPRQECMRTRTFNIDGDEAQYHVGHVKRPYAWEHPLRWFGV